MEIEERAVRVMWVSRQGEIKSGRRNWVKKIIIIKKRRQESFLNGNYNFDMEQNIFEDN